MSYEIKDSAGETISTGAGFAGMVSAGASPRDSGRPPGASFLPGAPGSGLLAGDRGVSYLLRVIALVLLGLMATACVGPAPLDADTPAPAIPSPPTHAITVNPIAPAGARALRVCLDVDPTMVPAVYVGVDAWRRVLAPWRDLIITGDLRHGCDALITEVAVGEHCHQNANGCVDQIGGLDRLEPDPVGIYLVRLQYEENAPLVVMHELGHVLGLDHVDGTLMAAVADAGSWAYPWRCPDAETIARLEWHLGATLAGCT